MLEISKYTNEIEEMLVKNDSINNEQNSQIKNIILDSFLLGHISGCQGDSRVTFIEFKESLEVVQQLRHLIDINALKYEQLIELYNNVFVNYENIQELYTMIEFQLFNEQDNFNELQFPFEQQHFNSQNELQNQQQYSQLEQQEQQIQSSKIQSQFQTQNQQVQKNIQNFSNINSSQFQNFDQNQQQVTNEQNNFRFKNQFSKFVPYQKQIQQSEDNNNTQNFNTFNQFPQNNHFYQKPQQLQINQNEIEPINQFPQAFINQVKNNPFKTQMNQTTFQQQTIKQQEFQNNNPPQQQFQEKQQNQNQFPNSDIFIINEMKQMRESEIIINNQNQLQEERKTQNKLRIQQQSHPVHNFQMKVQQNPEVQIKQEQNKNNQLECISYSLISFKESESDSEDLDNLKYDFTKDCDICFVKLDLEEMMVLDCGHIFHLNCLNQTCLTQMQSRQFPIYCPNQYCKKPIIYNDLAKILDRINLERYEQLTFQQYIDSHGDEYSWCPTPDCKFVFISEGENHFQCPVCSKQYCLNCKAEFHHGQTCEQYMTFKNMNKEDQQFYQFVQGAKVKQCPRCKFWVEKSKGCNHMTCRCKFQFCYTCGQDYNDFCKCKDNNILIFQAFQ